MTADMTRQEVRFIRWDVPDKKQEDLPDLIRNGERARIDNGQCVFTALGETATAFWKNGGNRMEYVKTMQDGTDGDLFGGTIPKITGTSACYCRAWLIKLLQNMTSDYVRLRVDDGTTLMVMLGEVGEKPAAAIIAPRIDTEVKE
jgi:hypothetical protein